MESGVPKNQRDESGFTLIELMLVVMIIAIIAAIAVPRVAGNTEKAKIVATQQTISSLESALDTFELGVGRFPTNEEGLESLVEKPTGLSDEDAWAGPYMREIPRDGWNREVIYKYPGERIDYDLISLGSDGQEGTDDDITNFRRDEK